MTSPAHPGRMLLVNMPVADFERSKGVREEVDPVSAAALAAGGSEAEDAEDFGFMYSRSFFDLAGHGWRACGWTRWRQSRGPRRPPAGRRRPGLTA